MKFFSNCNTDEEAKLVYRKLVKMFHPDKGGDKELMVELQEQYDRFKEGVREEKPQPQKMSDKQGFGTYSYGNVHSRYNPSDFYNGFQRTTSRMYQGESADIVRLNSELSQVKSERDKLASQYNQLRERLLALEKECDAIKRDSLSTYKALDILRSKYSELEQENHALNQQLEVARKVKPYPKNIWEFLKG